jgi:hypothetical protein
MVGEAFEFEGDGAEPLGAEGGLGSGQGLERASIRRGVGDGGVPRHRFHLINGAAMRPARQRLLDAPVLIAERDFHMQDLLARALKTEVARLDDAGMHGSHRHFVDLGALDAEETAHRRPGAVVLAHRLEPGMPLGDEAVLLPNFAFEQVRLRMRRCQAGKEPEKGWLERRPKCCPHPTHHATRGPRGPRGRQRSCSGVPRAATRR